MVFCFACCEGSGSGECVAKTVSRKSASLYAFWDLLCPFVEKHAIFVSNLVWHQLLWVLFMTCMCLVFISKDFWNNVLVYATPCLPYWFTALCFPKDALDNNLQGLLGLSWGVLSPRRQQLWYLVQFPCTFFFFLWGWYFVLWGLGFVVVVLGGSAGGFF